MNVKEYSDLRHERNQLIVKSNSLIQKTRYSLGTQQQKILLYIISKIKPTDEDFKIYNFDLKELCKVCGIEENGNNYKSFKENIKSLRDKSFWIETEEKDFLISWIERVEINKNETTVSFRLDERLKPYLLEIKNNFTSYELSNILAFKSKFSIRLYEILQSYLYQNEKYFDIEELKNILQIADKYTDYKNFRVNVIDKSIQEINKYTNLNINYQPVRKCRKYIGITFYISIKESADDMIKAYKNVVNVLDKKER